jgi:hypothetical protein
MSNFRPDLLRRFSRRELSLFRQALLWLIGFSGFKFLENAGNPPQGLLGFPFAVWLWSPARFCFPRFSAGFQGKVSGN